MQGKESAFKLLGMFLLHQLWILLYIYNVVSVVWIYIRI